MIIVQQLLILRILKVAPRHGVHVVEAKVPVLGVQKAPDGGVLGHEVGEREAVLEAVDTPGGGRVEGQGGRQGDHLHRGLQHPASIQVHRKPT